MSYVSDIASGTFCMTIRLNRIDIINRTYIAINRLLEILKMMVLWKTSIFCCNAQFIYTTVIDWPVRITFSVNLCTIVV